LRLILGCDEMVASWVGEKLGTVIQPPYTAIGLTKDGLDLCARAVFNDFTGSNVEMTVASTGVSKGFARAIAAYVFRQLGVNRLSIKTKRSNKAVQRLAPRLGFKFEGISARYFGPSKADDAIRYVLFPEDARKWLDEHS